MNRFSSTPLTAPTPSVLETLKQVTWPYHKRLEARLDWLKPDLSQETYQRVLEKFWGFYQPMEACFASFPELQVWVPDLALRTKLPRLTADLHALGLPREVVYQLPCCQTLPVVDTAAAALGCLYVLEGSTLGGRVISRHLKHTLNLDAQNGAAFFNAYGEQTDAQWQAFRQYLTAAPADENVLAQSACETFTTLEHWLCPSLP